MFLDRFQAEKRENPCESVILENELPGARFCKIQKNQNLNFGKI
jgi:hypothetical protein